MNSALSYDKYISQVGELPIHRIGVVYCTSNLTAKGREFEKLADCEVIHVASAVQAALQEKGFQVQLVDLDPTRIAELKRFDWVINLTETIYGFPFTDYEIAQLMEQLGINFTGSGSQPLNTCLDKAVTKAELMKYGILTPIYDVFTPGERVQTQCQYPVIVKPVHEDGSIGITSESIARSEAELAPRVEKIHAGYHQAALVEEFIEGRDITASILGNGADTVVLPLSEITYTKHSRSKFLTFEAKWLSETPEFQSTAAQCPCQVDPAVENAIRQTALQAYRIMGCRDYARVDFRLKGNLPYVLEVNPNPCINPVDSGFVRCGKAAGLSYADLIYQILVCSVQNYSGSHSLVPCEFLKVEAMND